MDCAYNIITANFSGGKTHATTARVYQWSRGIELCITGADNLPQTFKAHFSVQKKGGVATTIVGIDERVDVPNVLFTIGKDIHVWLGASETEDDAEILYTVDIPVAPAPMPEYYDAEDTGVFDAVVEQVSGYAATATAAANSAGASATAAAGSASAAAASASSAAGSAGAAEQARADAVTAKGQAETAAQTATEKALQTAQNASQAALDAGRAESAAERAESAEAGAGAAKTAAEAAAQSAAASSATADEKATLAGQSATAAAGSASAAAQSAASIEGDVQIASQKASEARTAAGQAVTAKEAAQTAQQGAETAATNAGQSASTATTKASEAAQSASGAAQSKTDAEAAATRAEQAAATLMVDTALSYTSTNPVQNKVITGELTDVKTALDAVVITTKVPNKIFINDIPSVQKIAGINAAVRSSNPVGIEMSVLTTMDTYWVVADRDYDLFFDTTDLPAYLAIVHARGYIETVVSGSSTILHCAAAGTRYRKSESNLPTSSNKLRISAGDAIAITITAGKNVSIYGYGYDTLKYVAPNPNFKADILESNIIKKNYLKYVSGAGVDASTEKVEVYIPVAHGYVRYDFLHTISTSINSNVWRVGYAYHTDDEFNIDYALTTSGEWECAVKLDGRSDFSGGYAHGDEVMNGITFIVDGEPVDITAFTEITAFKELSIIEDSTFYDPNDSTTAFASHGSEHLFTDDGLTIKQSINFSLAETVNTMYMAMLPIAKAVSNMVVPNSNYVPLSTDTARRLYDTDGAVIYKTDGKVKADFSAPRFEYLKDGFTFLCLDNGSTAYNKCYFCNTLGNVSVSAGKLMKSETKYKFAISE